MEYLLDDLEFEEDPPEFAEESTIESFNIVSTNINICPDCNIEMSKEGDLVTCPRCHYINEDIVNDSVDTATSEILNNYSMSNTSATPLRVQGPGSYKFQRRVIGNSSDYKKKQRKDTSDQIRLMLASTETYIDPSIINDTVELYFKIQQHTIKRGDVRRGTMAACFYYVCTKANRAMKPKEIAACFGIDQSDVSNGMKVIGKLVSTDLVKIETSIMRKEDVCRDFLVRYMAALDLDQHPEYATFLSFLRQLIRFTVKYRISPNSQDPSKCAGAIYLLTSYRPDLEIRRETIEKCTNTSKSTFYRYCSEVKSFLASAEPELQKVKHRLELVFERHGIRLA